MPKNKSSKLQIDINDQSELQGIYTKCYPRGSGPLGMMRLVAALIEAIAKDKGFKLETPPKI